MRKPRAAPKTVHKALNKSVTTKKTVAAPPVPAFIPRVHTIRIRQTNAQDFGFEAESDPIMLNQPLTSDADVLFKYLSENFQQVHQLALGWFALLKARGQA